MMNNEKMILDAELETIAGGNDGSEVVYHTIVPGDTLGGIAKKYGTTVDRLMQLNPYIKDRNKIYVGNRVRVR